MTLRVTVEIVPHGDEYKRYVVDVLNISNISGGETSEYVIEHNAYKQLDAKTPKVKHNRSDGALKLVYLALKKILKE